MKNQAKYLCCLGGFIGFLSFFTISLFLGLDVLAAVIRGSVGCLFLALSFRGILHLALKSMVSSEPGGSRASQMDKVTSGNEAASSDAVEPKTETVLASAKEATAEAVSEPSPTVAEVAPA
tara:strand:- start:1699 stop:2061 length:363 start_codon:yes stop_codon:yes gene_type:complete